ncbi:MAG: spondin domain-containing protein [Gemmatimonadales bacterium]|nr:spondin domain-containing protein [Gemmatimonadales bacterium]
MISRQAALLTATKGLALAGCDDDDTAPRVTTFTVTVQDVSTPGLLATDRAGGTVPLSPGAYAVFTGSNPLFASGSAADEGTELVAEDGFPETKDAMLDAAANVSQHGIFESPGGPDAGPAIFAGETATFTVDASPGDRLQFESMFVQSNDWFFAFSDGGIDLFEGDTPISGDVTDRLALYDAGTEEDTAPGTGADQKPVQDPAATNVGAPDDDTAIRLASTSEFAIPATAAVIRVTVTPNQ